MGMTALPRCGRPVRLRLSNAAIEAILMPGVGGSVPPSPPTILPPKGVVAMKRAFAWFALLLLCAPAVSVVAGKSSEKEDLEAKQKREKIDLTARETLDRLFKDSPSAKELYDKAHGYAVFDNLKVSFGITGGGGSGVAVHKASGRRTYMNMGTAGVGFGLGGQKYQVVFLFETQKTFDDFVEKGWQADASANAVAWETGANLQAKFVNGMAVYQFSDKGLMLQADIAGTKYWKSDKLNRDADASTPKEAVEKDREKDE